MLLIHYYALAVAAVLLTAAWLFKPDARTAITTLGAFLAWGMVALFGGATQTHADAGAELINHTNGTTAVAIGDQLVDAPVADEVRLFAVLWAFLSVLALALYVWGVYPPEHDQPADAQSETRR